MASLSITYTFVPGNIIRASEHNQNMTDIVTWANGNISDTNFTTMTGVVTWNVSTNVKSISSTNTGTAGSASFAQNGTLSAGNSAVKISSNAAQSGGNALLELLATSSSNAIPSLLITDAGTTGPAFKIVSTTKPSVPAPVMTTAQRNALTSPAEGSLVFDSTLHTLFQRTNSAWENLSTSQNVSAAVDNSTIEYSGGVLRVKDSGITNAKIQNNPTFPGSLFGSASSSGGLYGFGGTYNINNSPASTLALAYGGSSQKGYRFLSGKVSGGTSTFSAGGEGCSVSRSGVGSYFISRTIAGNGIVMGYAQLSNHFTFNSFGVAGVQTNNNGMQVDLYQKVTSANPVLADYDFYFIMIIDVA